MLFTTKRGRRAQPVVVSNFCGLHPVKTPFSRATVLGDGLAPWTF